MVPVALLFLSSGKLMKAIGQDERVSDSACQFVSLMIPGVWAMSQFDATKRFCTSMFKPNLPFYTQMISTFFHLIWCNLFINILDMKVVGAALSLNLTYFSNLFILDYWISISKDFEGTWIKHDIRAFEEWGEYLRIGIYGAMLECLGWWNLNICFLFTGYLGVTQIATQVVIMQIKNFTTMIPTGVAFAASGLVGNCIGMDQVRRGQLYANICIIFSMLVTFVMLTIFTVFADSLSRLFTDNDEIVRSTQASFWSLFLYIFFSTIKGVQNGVVRALGFQKKNTFITLVFAYGLGIPLASFFCFTLKMGLQGLWFGISVANLLLVLAINHLISTTPWESIAQQKCQEN
mmetsp:Transcript_2578/g.4318  ORF Transcript_2578/g.4318 Transcript_2578/m.4318 type:complete len:348 (-) Transcript_2578:98-1141(-)